MQFLFLTTFGFLVATLCFPTKTLGQYYEDEAVESYPGPYPYPHYDPSLPASEELESPSNLPNYDDELFQYRPVPNNNRVGRVRAWGSTRPRRGFFGLGGGWGRPGGWEHPGIRYTGSIRPYISPFHGAFVRGSHFLGKAWRGWYGNNNY